MMLTFKYRLKDRSAAKRLREHAIAVNHVAPLAGESRKNTRIGTTMTDHIADVSKMVCEEGSR